MSDRADSAMNADDRPAVHPDDRNERELQELRGQISQMGARVVQTIEDSVWAFVSRDGALAGRIIESDHEIDRLEAEAYELSLGILASGRLAGPGLRFVTTGLKLVTDLERMGDLCVNLCKRAIELDVEVPPGACAALLTMAEIATEMVAAVLDAFIESEPLHARQIIDRHRTMNAYYGQLFGELITYTGHDSRGISRATRLHAPAKYLERIGDDATHLAEMVVLTMKAGEAAHRDHIKDAV